MNQILYNKDDYPNYNNNNYDYTNIKIEAHSTKNKKHIFKIQFIISCTLTIALILGYSIYLYNKENKENLSQKMMQDYNISRLYANNTNNNSNIYEENGTKFTVIRNS